MQANVRMVVLLLTNTLGLYITSVHFLILSSLMFPPPIRYLQTEIIS